MEWFKALSQEGNAMIEKGSTIDHGNRVHPARSKGWGWGEDVLKESLITVSLVATITARTDDTAPVGSEEGPRSALAADEAAA